MGGGIVGGPDGGNEALPAAEAPGDGRVGRLAGVNEVLAGSDAGRTGVVLAGCFPSLTDKAGKGSGVRVDGSGTSVEVVEDTAGDRGTDDEGDDCCGRWLSPSNGK